MALEIVQTPFGPCTAEVENYQIGSLCYENRTQIGRDDLTDLDLDAFTKPYALEAWNYIIEKVNKLIACGAHYGLVPTFEFQASEANPHVWTIREIHDILYQICPEIMARYGNKPIMWDKRWLDTVIEVLRNGWCQNKLKVEDCYTPPPPPPKSRYIHVATMNPAYSVSGWNIVTAGCTLWQASGPVTQWTSDMTNDWYWSSDQITPIPYAQRQCPVCTADEYSGSIRLTYRPGWFNGSTRAINYSPYFVTLTLTGPLGTVTLNDTFPPTRVLSTPGYFCSQSPLYTSNALIAIQGTYGSTWLRSVWEGMQ